MLKRCTRTTSSVLVALAMLGVARAQIGRLWDPTTVETVSGEVVSVEPGGHGQGPNLGVQLELKTDKGTLEVHLAPAPYIEHQGMKIEPKDKIEVKGSRVAVGNKTLLLAAQVKKGDQTLKLRDDKGMPLWRPAGPAPPPAKQKT